MKEAKKKLEDLGKKVLNDIEKKENPSIEVPIRSLSNIIYDKKTGMLTLGEKTAKRFLFHTGHAKKFMQTMLVAAFCKELLDQNLHTSLRDLFYALKRTLPNSQENTFNEQNESDPIVVDLEVMLNLLREQLHLNADVRGRVVGDVIIRDRGDTIDWSKLGSGGWAIPSNVEDIEFKKVNANFILAIEKNAAFERLHEDKFWRKHKCILVTTQGQAARGTRRLIQRLANEFNLPVYVFTDADSIPFSEVVVVRDKNTKEVLVGSIGNLLEKFINKEKDREIIFVPWETLSMSKNGTIEWREVEYAYRHRIKGKLLRIFTRGRGVIEVTPSHSLFTFKNGKIEAIKASELKEGDYIVVSNGVPPFEGEKKVFYVSEILRKILPENKQKRIELIYDDKTIHTFSETNKVKVKFVRHKNGRQKITNKIKVDEDLAWVLGLWVVKGSLSPNCINFSLSSKEEEKIRKVEKILKEKLNLNVSLTLEGKRKTGIRISVWSSILSKIFSYFGLKSGAFEKRIPSFIFNSSPEVQIAFIKGLIDGNGNIVKYNNIIYFTKSETLAKQFSILLLSFGVIPTIIRCSKGFYLRFPSLRMNEKLKEDFKISSTSKLYYSDDSIYGLPDEGITKRILINSKNNFSALYPDKTKPVNQDGFVDSIREFEITEELFEDFDDLKPFENMTALVKIKRIEEVEYEGDVFDLAVPISNSFIGGSGIVFHNSYGWYIYSVIKYGSMSLAHVSDRLGTPNARFLGLTITDIDKFGLKDFTIKAEEVDIKRAKEMLSYEWFKHPAWQRELKLMIERKVKAELEALSGKGLKFITENYLPEKIEKQDFLP
ncbi:MAG: hypothetical protein NZ942_00965 [Candidatus Aenigmarchaeota archaeon]|nr:hypothetical protein [Candidatus Aenigmarchaeota archaeon]